MTTNTTTHTLLRAEGFSCPSCVNKIEKRVSRLKGVDDVKVHFATARIEVDHDESQVSVDDLVDAAGKVRRRQSGLGLQRHLVDEARMLLLDLEQPQTAQRQNQRGKPDGKKEDLEIAIHGSGLRR